ncbi:endodeoxyribonuclease [Haplosporangium gracile]|nr:endodeoxyribonuclease [Haplosporangium gracile]
MIDGTFNASTITKSPLPPSPVISSSSPPFTQRSVYGSSRTSRILRATELIHENVCKDTISSKRDMYYRDVMAFGCQPAVDGIVEDLACTFEVPRSSLNVVAGTRSVFFGSVRMLVKVLGGRQRGTSGVKGRGECEECEGGGQLPWLQEEIADSPFSKTQTLSNFKQSHQRQEEEEECDPLDSRFSQTSYNTLVPIPVRFSDIVEIEIHPRTRFVLAIEKEATFSNLISLGFCETHGPCILLTSKGYPDQVARQLLKALSEMVLSGVYLREFPYTAPGAGGNCRSRDCDMSKSSVEVPSVCQSSMQTLRPSPLEIPLLALMDCDPQGIEIYLTYRCGSIKSAYENANLAVPALKCLGQFPSDWNLVLNPRTACTASNEVHLGQEQEKENDEEQERLRRRLKEAFIPLTDKDRKKLERLLTTHPYICQHAQWKNQIARMLEVDAKTEIQSLHQLGCTSSGSGASVVVGNSEGESAGGGNIAGGAEGGGELAPSSALVLYLERKLQNPESWL